MPDTPLAARAPRADAERNRRRILDAATSVFAQHGPSATLSDVAQVAGVGIGTIYRKFPDKTALLDALLQDKIDVVMQVALDAATEDDAGAAFRRYLSGMIALHASDRSLATVLFAPDRANRVPAAFTHRLAPVADELIERAIEAGELRDGFTRQDTTVLAVMVSSIAAVTRHLDPLLWRRYAQIVVDGTRPGAMVGPLSPEPLPFAITAEALGRTL